jgi:putative transcriptional regulator
VRTLKPDEILKTRERLGMTQDEFAAAFHLKLWTVRNWEQGRSTPSGAAAVLLWLLAKIPEQILEALKRR